MGVELSRSATKMQSPIDSLFPTTDFHRGLERRENKVAHNLARGPLSDVLDLIVDKDICNGNFQLQGHKEAARTIWKMLEYFPQTIIRAYVSIGRV